MDSPFVIAVIVVFALALGALLGWLLASRPVQDLRARLAQAEGAGRELDDKFKAAIRDLAAASERAERVDAMQDELAAVRQNRDTLAGELATLRANIATLKAPATVHAADARHPPPGTPCSLVFLDPPYGQGLVEKAVARLDAAGWIAPGALLVADTGVAP